MRGGVNTMNDKPVVTAQPKLYQLMIAPVEKLKPAEYNPRTIDEPNLIALMNSIDKDPDFMKVRPIIINMYPGREYVVVGGNQRLKAVKELGWDKVPVVAVSVPLNQEKKWNIKDNVNQGKFDNALLQGMLVEIKDEGMDLTDIGFTPEETVTIMDLDTSPIDPSDDPENTGTTPRKKKIITVNCPNCNHEFTVDEKV